MNFRKLKIMFRCFLFVLLLNFLVASTFIILNDKEIEGDVSSEIGSQIYYDNYRWVYFKRFRDCHEIFKYAENNTLQYVNYRYVAGGTNYTDVIQTIGYSSSTTIGSTVTAGINLDFQSVFELELGYAINLATTTTVSATASVPPHQQILVYASDTIVTETELWTLVDRELLSWGNWVSYSYVGESRDIVEVYGGTHFTFLYHDVA